MKYAIMLKPNSNIPFFNSMKALCIKECLAVFSCIGFEAEDFSVMEVGKGACLTFSAAQDIGEFLSDIYSLSFFYALFKIEGEALVPLRTEDTNFIGEDISMRLKYNGKTSEVFTRLLLNMGIYSAEIYSRENLNILDPMCGKGTTLFEGLILGHNVYGIELSKKFSDEFRAYTLRYLKEARYKHRVEKQKITISKKTLGESFKVTIGRDKAEMASGPKTLQYIRGDAKLATSYFKQKFFSVIAVDLPYGVQHMGSNKQRDLSGLLTESFVSLKKLLKKGGAMSISFNTYSNSREQLIGLLESAGLKVLKDELHTGFEHRVSQAINRDIIVCINR